MSNADARLIHVVAEHCMIHTARMKREPCPAHFAPDKAQGLTALLDVSPLEGIELQRPSDIGNSVNL